VLQGVGHDGIDREFLLVDHDEIFELMESRVCYDVENRISCRRFAREMMRCSSAMKMKCINVSATDAT
jgi:hypothetical protein